MKTIPDELVSVIPVTGCAIWLGATTNNGYGHLRNEAGYFEMAHRKAYRDQHGYIPAGLILRHRCNVRTCINPDHLVPGTQVDNEADKKTTNFLA